MKPTSRLSSHLGRWGRRTVWLLPWVVIALLLHVVVLELAWVLSRRHGEADRIFRVELVSEDNPFVGDDGAIVRELASPGNSSLTRHSLAEIRHPPGTASQEHIHTEAEEVYYVMSGRGGIRVDGETREIGPGDVVVIVPGERHKVWQVGEKDLVLLVTCVPAYSVEEVIFTD